MMKIAIFVSHRIDMESKCIRNPLYHHMRCGAVDDRRENIKIAGDDTGDNISDKHDYLSEFTVQYWAWKNYDADYYGLCHYRRYLSFADQEFPIKFFQGFIEEKKITHWAARKYNLCSPKKMRKEIKKYDVIYGMPYSVTKTPTRGSVFDTMRKVLIWHLNVGFTDEILDTVIALVKERFPQYYPAIIKRMASDEVIGFNLFVMKKELFFKMCEFQFDIMEQVASHIDMTQFDGNNRRIIAYIGEILYGTFIQWLRDEQKYKMAEKQMVLFWTPQTDRIADKSELKRKVKNFLKKVLLKVSPTYRVLCRVEDRQTQEFATIKELQNVNEKFNQILNRLELMIWLEKPVFPENMPQVKESFWRSYPSADGKLRTVQIANMWMLHRMKELCDSVGIRFWLHGGSLVGGLRHSGYIPWDDDIDVGMMRNDFSKLKELLNDNAIYKIQEVYYTSASCRSYRFMRRDIVTNAFVDIFIYDYYNPTEEDIQHDWGKLLDLKMGLARQYITMMKVHGIQPRNETLDDKPSIKLHLDKLIDMWCKRISSKEPTDWIAWGLDNNFENRTRPAWWLGRIFQASDIFPLQECTFEGETMYIPNNFKKYVFTEYGIDYLDMPNDINISKHLSIYFSKQKDLDAIEALILDEKGRGEWL